MTFPPPLPGEFAIRTYTNNFVSYSPATGSLTTSATALTTTEKFFITTQAPGFSLIQTVFDQNYVAVAPQGGLGVTPTGPGSGLQPQLFTLVGPNSLPEVDPGNYPSPGYGNFMIQIYDGSYLVAAEGGGQTSNAFLTGMPGITLYDVFADFWIVKCGDLGNGYRYAIRAALPQYQLQNPVGSFLTAVNGGGLTQKGVSAANFGLTSEGIFTLIRLDAKNGYALQTSDGFNYVTAVDGGGLADGDNLHTDATRIAGWETFQIVDQLDGTYAIQTESGFYLAVANEPDTVGVNISTRISSPDLAPEIGYVAKFEFIMIPNQMEIIGWT